MNERITQYLSHYIDHPDPCYAIMLKGKWGCGKSFFVNNWLENNKKLFEVGEISLEPIYVSLYGLKETSQITKAIDQVLHPYLYSKGAEFTKKLCGVLGKIALKATINWNDNNEISLEPTLDSLSLLSSKSEEIKCTKLIVFDDLERCLIEMKLLLGYINNLVEHGSCHVIIVGDETHTSEDAKNTLLAFKEKTVGREFEVEPDIDAAIDYFLSGEDLPHCEWIKLKKELVSDVFKATQCDNLRILRQCLYDYNTLYSEVNGDLLKNGEEFMQSLFATFIATYCDYRSEQRDLYQNSDWLYTIGFSNDNNKKKRIDALLGKYKWIEEKYHCQVFNPSHISHIVDDIESGCSLKDYVESSLVKMQQDNTIHNLLANYLDVSSIEFMKAYKALAFDITHHNVSNVYMFGRSIALLVYFDTKGIVSITKKIKYKAKTHIHSLYSNAQNKEDLYELKMSFLQGVNSFGSFHEAEIGIEITQYANNIFEECEKNLKNKFESVLSNITDINVEQLILLSGEPTPDHQCSYNMTSIFKNSNPTKLYNAICKLSNASINKLCQFISYHYNFHCVLGDGCNRYSDDLSVLDQLKTMLEKKSDQKKGLDKYVLSRLIRYLDGAINRAKGDNNPIDI